MTKEIVEVIRINECKKVKQKYRLKNKLIMFTYYSNLFLKLSY